MVSLNSDRQPFCTHVLNQGLVSSHFEPSPVIAAMFGDYNSWAFDWPDRLSQSIEDENVWEVEIEGFEAGQTVQWKFFLGPMIGEEQRGCCSPP